MFCDKKDNYYYDPLLYTLRIALQGSIIDLYEKLQGTRIRDKEEFLTDNECKNEKEIDKFIDFLLATQVQLFKSHEDLVREHYDTILKGTLMPQLMMPKKEV